MGFFEGLIRGLNASDSEREILDLVNDEDDEILSSDYRRTGMRYADSNNGWYTCVKCGKSFRAGDMDIDHIVPKSKGGTNSRYNLQCICKHCNRSKGNDTSETKNDLKRRKKELEKQEQEDLEFLRRLRRNKEEE